MNIALVAKRFINNDTEYNLNVIIQTIYQLMGKVDLICFGESFLQGFDCLSWNFDKDKEIAVTKNSSEIKLIKKTAKRCKVAVAFGYIELLDEKLYSSYQVISNTGKEIVNYRRMSIGWKEKIADNHYCEGTEIMSFELTDKTITIGLCGDLWNDEIVEMVSNKSCDMVLWPVYVDYSADKWNNKEKAEYAKQAKKLGTDVFFVNSLCDGDENAKGGAVYFKDGEIISETLPGEESILMMNI